MFRKSLKSKVLAAAICAAMTAGMAAGTTVVFAEENGVQRENVNVGIEADPADLSPFGPATTGRTAVMDAIYETLGYIGNDGEFVGVLAKDYELAEDESTLTFHLYDYIKDTAGNPITASDVVFSYNSKAEAGNLFNIAFIKDVEAVDDYTVQFNLNPPLNVTNIANLVNNLYVVSEKSYNDSADGMVTGGVVSTAHYTVKDYEGGYLLTLEKNDDYWQTDELTAPRSKANVGTINYYVLTESNQRTMALESKTIDMCWSIANADLPKFEDGGEQSEDYWVYEYSDNLSNVLIFNASEDHLTNNASLRKAIGYAMDNEMIAQGVYNGHGAANFDFARTNTVGINESWKDQDDFYQYDIEKATELTKEAGYNGEALTLLTNTDQKSVDMAALIQGFAAQAGITIEINSVDSANVNTYFADASQWDIYLTNSAAEIYCVQPWVRHLDNRASGTTTGFLKDDELQSLLEDASNMSTSNQDTIDACHNYIVDNAIIYGIGNPYLSFVVPEDCSDVVLGYKVEILPGACTYTE